MSWPLCFCIGAERTTAGIDVREGVKLQICSRLGLCERKGPEGRSKAGKETCSDALYLSDSKELMSLQR